MLSIGLIAWFFLVHASPLVSTNPSEEQMHTPARLRAASEAADVVAEKAEDATLAALSLAEGNQSAQVGNSAKDNAPQSREKMCRYCFGEQGDMISPCACTGGQKWVHLECLQNWQRSILTDQPTHPALYHRDERQEVCNVCQSKYTTKLTRHELLSSFTGQEVATLIDKNSVLAAHHDFSLELERQLLQLPQGPREKSRFWVGGVFVIVNVVDGCNRTQILNLEFPEELAAVREKLLPNLEIWHGDSQCVLVNEGSLANAGCSITERRRALKELSVPARLVLRCNGDFGEDTILAVNLVRRSPVSQRERNEAATDAAMARFAKISGVRPQAHVLHYVGGPCNPHRMRWCIVPDSTGGGWTITSKFDEALELADAVAKAWEKSKGNNSSAKFKALDMAGSDFFQGQQVRLVGLRTHSELNGMIGTIVRFHPSEDGVAEGRWLVTLPGVNEDKREIKVRSENLIEAEQDEHDMRPKVPVLVFWGDAQWSRVQLLGEIAKGHWGLCRAQYEDLLTRPVDLLAQLTERLLFAPRSPMTETYIGASKSTLALPPTVQSELLAYDPTRSGNQVEFFVASHFAVASLMIVLMAFERFQKLLCRSEGPLMHTWGGICRSEEPLIYTF
eukprot:gnl/MRDRNA2_/MRDRNA2_106868_c0_seq1.p1 gnl/MRDRNA2_/MRDRNA2_106868_c0~~gnl/MRDRNA2_/MRDRNA2_106868_c0_seq1.p1  ORF type:complete len:620 (+),score=118.74 gnl/MRDRNA2_/MRDRNA2_106868_c0_seq1:131-1990(+)